MKDSFPKQFWTSVILIGSTILVAVVLMIFLLDDISARAGDIAADYTLTAMRNGNVALLAKLTSDAGSAVPYATAINRLLPSVDALIQFPQSVQSVAATYNVTAKAQFTGDPSESTASTPGFVPFSLSADGKFPDLMNFMQGIELQSNNFLLTLDTSDLTVDASGSARLSATGRVFFQ